MFEKESRDQSRCSSLLNKGWWTDDSYQSWQPASCMMHNYKPLEISTCLNHSRIVYVGDSIIREQFFSAVKLIDPETDTSGEAHTDKRYEFSKENLIYEFWWDPYLNQTSFLHTPRPSLLVMGTGLWQVRYLEEAYYDEWKSSVDRVLNLIKTRSIADAVLLAPVEIPQYDKLGQERANTMTIEKISTMNAYLKKRQEENGVDFGIPFVWNDVSLLAKDVTEDGLHFNSVVTKVQAQIALNFRCNNQLEKSFPMENTCCFDYPKPKWYQNTFFLFFLIWIPTGYFILSNSGLSTSLIQKPFPNQKVSQAFFVFGLCVIYMYFGDRTQMFGKIQKHFDATVFTIMMIVIGILGVSKLQHKTEGDQGFLNRHQTDEWKGWMQVIILVYHFCGASRISGIYNAVRILVAAYLFQTGYGHFFFFYKKADFGIARVLNVLVRLNFLTFVLQYLMDTDYISYYFTPLVSFWFLVIWVVMYVGHQWNKVPSFLLVKLAASCMATTLLIQTPGVLETLFDLLQVIFNTHWNPAEWRFRLALDAYIVYVGMLFAYAYIKVTEHKLMDHPKWSVMKNTGMLISCLALIWYFWFELTCIDKFTYNQSHPYISWIPILAFVILRNANTYMRNTHSEFYAFVGKISLETFIGQFHMWLAADTKGLLVLLVHPSWVQGMGWWINWALSSCLFVFVCYYMSQTTHEISTWICSKMNPPSQSAGKYQAVPLLPTAQGSSSQSEVKIEEEIWYNPFSLIASIEMPSQKSFITKVKLGKAKKQNRPLPQWFRLKTDTKIRWNAKRRNWRHTKLNI
ncbi:hypothetical protein G6F56_002723 [Rhizopus delemar]|nr:hypothetical protein G6F56_002723 [Rhizopus delemar]RCH96469.1 hypothetical protein CU098_006275 [Rhizopus stolonifer]